MSRYSAPKLLFLLSDYSYFQFSWDSHAAWRLAYFPNPWIAGVADAQDTLDQWEALEEMGFCHMRMQVI
jgi:hypothetical protein